MRSTGHIRQRSPGLWELRYSLGTDPATGKRRLAGVESAQQAPLADAAGRGSTRPARVDSGQPEWAKAPKVQPVNREKTR
jgi:hypothetical protein